MEYDDGDGLYHSVIALCSVTPQLTAEKFSWLAWWSMHHVEETMWKETMGIPLEPEGYLQQIASKKQGSKAIYHKEINSATIWMNLNADSYPTKLPDEIQPRVLTVP